MARAGELAQPRLPAPPGVRTVLGFSRMSKSAIAIVRRAVEDDENFRARVALAAEEATVGRAGWLWLHRPDGWETDPAMAAEGDDTGGSSSARLRRERDGAEAAAERHRRAAAEADEAWRRAVAQGNEARQDATKARAAADEFRHRLGALEAERNTAVRTQKRLEADLAEAKRDLRLAREAARQAETELLEARPSPGARPRPPPPSASPANAAAQLEDASAAFDRRAAQDAVAAASGAATDLARALADVAASLNPDQPGGDRRSASPEGQSDRGRSRRPRRAAPALPPGTLAGSAEANRFLVASSEVLLLVDGYNLARAVWSGLEPEEERRRTVTVLEEVRARSGAPVTVVFDGEDHTTAPPASRSIRVLFSATGQTADDVIAELVRSLPSTQQVVVVSSDREVADDARRQGAAVLGSRDFLTAAGR